MVSEEKVESGFRNVGGDRFNRVHRLQRLVVVVVFSGFRGGTWGDFGFRNTGGERSRSSLKLIGFSVGACVFCLRSFLN